MKRAALLVMLLAATASMAAQDRIRSSVNLGGLYGWFDEDRETLKRNVDKYLADAGEVKVVGTPVAIVAPHAGLKWGGPTAAYAYKAIVGRTFSRVIVLAPSHTQGFRGGSIAAVDAYNTPLGNIPLDKLACAKLLETDIVNNHPDAHRTEHSLQNELPFLQRTLADFKLVPIVVGGYQEDADLAKLADAVKSVLTPDTLIVVSSDFTHYGRSVPYVPFTDDIAAKLRKLDGGAIDEIVKVDPKGFTDYLARTRATVCGRYPIAVMLRIFAGRADIRGTLVHYTTSGALTGSYTYSVSYAAVVLSKVDDHSRPAPFAVERDDDTPPTLRDEVVEGDKLTEKEKKLLLRMAREQLESILREKKSVDARKYRFGLTRKLMRQGGVFVTLKTRGELRGCIGTITPVEPLYTNVLRNTVNAALYDPRFRDKRIKPDEIDDVDIEISYLSPQKPVESYTEIVIGRHGIVLEKLGRSAVFLPQVPLEQKWDRDTTLTQLALKAKLPGDAWKKDCTFHVFEAQAFGEKEYGKPEKEED